MKEKQKSLITKIEQSVTSSPVEHILNVIKAGLSTTPFCGGIASLMTDYIPSGKHKRLEQFAKQIAEDLTNLKDRVEANRILTDEFAFLFEKCFKGAAENYQEDKIQAFRAILLNTAIGIDYSEEEKEYFLNLVNTLSVLHIRILRFMADPLSYVESHAISKEQIRGGFSDFFPVAIPGAALDVIISAFGDLHQYGLINTDKSIFGTMTSAQGLHLLGNRVSELGRKFISFCTMPK